ncbi:MAG: NUDIX hydrolase [Flavobacteriales bacterium]
MEKLGPWTKLKEEEVYASPWITVSKHDIIDPGGKPGTYSVVHFRSIAVGVVALDDELNTWIVGQYRYPTRSYGWEIPEGGSPRDIPPLDGAKRELREEAGIVAERWTEILRMDLSNSASDEHAILYVARGLTFHEPEPDHNEELTLRKLHFNELYAMVQNGEITDSLTVAAVLKVKLMMVDGALPA